MPGKSTGRKSKYSQVYDEQAFRLCLLGHTDAELAKAFEVEESTINNWKQNHPTFLESIINGREKADGEVVQALYKAAKGYSHPETIFHVVSDGSGLGSSVIGTDTIKQYPPNERAIRFWLMNRQRGKWTEKQEIGFTDKNGEDVKPFINLSTEALKALEQILTKADDDSSTETG